jgi:hypothetical protein
MTVSLWIPVEEAVRLDIDSLVEKFSDSAENLGGELVDDSETMGTWEWFEFGNLSTDQVRSIAAQHIRDHRQIRLADKAPDDNDFIEGDHVIVLL